MNGAARPMITLQLAKALMKALPVRPEPPDERVGDLQEVFRHERFLSADPRQRADRKSVV